VRIEGAYTFAAPREFVWSLLHDPEILQWALPGCERFEQLSDSQFSATLSLSQGPFKGQYRGIVRLADGVSHEGSKLILEGRGPEGLIWGNGTLSLDEKEGRTTLLYEGDVECAGNTVSESPRLLKTTFNSLIRQFLEAIDRYIQIQTEIHTTDLMVSTPRTGPIDMQDLVAEIKQDRRTTLLVLLLVTLTILMTLGVIVILVVLIRWVYHIVKQSVATTVHERKKEKGSLDLV